MKLGKAFLVTRLQTLLQTNRVHLLESEEARILAEELMEYEVKVLEDANDKYGAFKVGSQDDLVTALRLALQATGLGGRSSWEDERVGRGGSIVRDCPLQDATFSSTRLHRTLTSTSDRPKLHR